MVSCSGFRFLAMMTFFISATAFSAEAIKIELPCGKTPYPACDALKTRMLDGVAASKDVGFRAMVKELISGIYEGKIDAKGVESNQTARVAYETIGKPPICLALKIPENACKDEFLKNEKDQACPAISKVGQITRDKYFYGLGRATRGTLETAHVSGGMALGLSNQAIDIEREIGANALMISQTSACYGRAQAFQSALKGQTDVKLLERVAECESLNSATCSSKKYFESGMSTLHTTYLFLAKCRLLEEAAQKARRFSLKYVNRIETEIVQVCFARYRGKPAQMKACYASEYANWIRMRAKNEFTNLASVCGN